MNTSIKHQKNTHVALCVAVILFACGTAQAGWTIWNNTSGDGKWETSSNWSATKPDISTDAAIINNFATAGAVTATTANDAFDYMRIGHLGFGKLIINGANLSTTSAGQTPGNTREGIGYDPGNTGVLDLISGSMRFSALADDGNQTVGIAANQSAGTVNQTGGTMTFGGLNNTSVLLGSTNGKGEYNFTAGILESRRAFSITTGGSGTSIFKVNGYDAGSSIHIGGTTYNGTGDGAWFQRAGTTLSISIDGGTTQGSTRINVLLGTDGDANTNDGKATFASGSKLYLDFKSGAKSGTWTVLSAEGGIVNDGLALAAGVNADPKIQWSFDVVGNDLQVTAVVIPAGTLISIR